MRLNDWIVLMSLGLIWGTSYLFIKIAVQQFPPPTLVVIRLGLASVVLVPVVLLRRHPFPRDPRTWGRLVFLGAVNSAVPIGLIAWGEQFITSAAASILNATTPLWSVLFVSLLGEESLGWVRAAGVAVGFGGVTILLGLSPEELGRANLLGSLAVILASALYAAGMLYARRLGSLDPVVLSVGSLAGGALSLLPFALAAGVPARPSPAALGSLLALSLVGTAVAYLLYFYLVLNVGATSERPCGWR